MGLVIIPVVFLVLPIDFFDQGESVCLSVLFFDMTCYGCGMLRALKHLIFFDFSGAWELNKLSFIVFPLLSYVWIKEILRVKKSWRKSYGNHKN